MTSRWIRWPESHPLADGTLSPASGEPRMAFGADYNPEQWPEEIWAEDVRLMREAGVNIVSVGIFSWALLQPTPDTWDFGWLDRAIDLLHANGIAVDLATATASPPPWLTSLHPEILPVTRTGEIVWPGGRQQWRPTSPIFRTYALELVRVMASRYADHPAIAMWHVSNELGCHNAYDYSDDAAAAFRTWLEGRYGSLEALNAAWGTAFWSQNYSEWSQILPPRLAATHPNPTQQLDFLRFSSDALKDYLIAERDLLHSLTPAIPVTTNFMVMGNTKALDYADWASEVDVISNDHYFIASDPLGWQELSFSANLTGNLRGEPWFLMEHSTSAVNWQHVNPPKRPGELRRDSFTHVAHGADAVCFFQWRQSLAGAEKFHSAMLPHAGATSDVFRSVAALGADLAASSALVGTRKRRARIAVLFDWDSWWASELDSHPSSELQYRREALAWYSAALNNGLEVDVLPVGVAAGAGPLGDGGLTGYDMVIAPMLYVVPEALAAVLDGYARAGGHLVVGHFSGIADRDDHVYPGGYPGAFRDLLGISSQEFGPVLPGTTITLDSGATATLWTENVGVMADASSDDGSGPVEVLARFVDGPFPGVPAITSRTFTVPGAVADRLGRATYVATALDLSARTTLLAELADRSGIPSSLAPSARGLVEVATRESDTETFTFFISHADEALRVAHTPGINLLTGLTTDGDLWLDANGVAIIRSSTAAAQDAVAGNLPEHAKADIHA